jgi:multiple antibiotic resistance protein
MSPLLIKISKDFATLFTTINPIATLALFAGLTASLSRADRHLTALRACIYATIILVVAMTAGQVILDAIGIHMHSLKVAGGIILFLFGSQMLFGKMDEKPGRSPEEGRDLAVFPLAVPSIAGGGAMMAVIVLTDNDAILRVIGRQGASVLVRVMGLILCSLAVEIVLTALGVGPWGAVAPP